MEEKREQEKNSEQLYIEYRGNTPVHYAYGEPWVAQALFMGDISFDTEKEAREYWEKWKSGGRKKMKKECKTCIYAEPYGVHQYCNLHKIRTQDTDTCPNYLERIKEEDK